MIKDANKHEIEFLTYQIHSFPQQTFVKYPLYDKHYTKSWDPGIKDTEKKFDPCDIYILLGPGKL